MMEPDERLVTALKKREWKRVKRRRALAPIKEERDRG